MALGPLRCGDLRSVCSVASSQHAPHRAPIRQLLRSPQPQKGLLTGPEPCPLPGLDIKEISQFFFLALKWGLLQMQTRGSLWETLPITSFYIASFMPISLKALSQTSVIVSPLQMAPKGKHGKLSGSTKVTQKSQSRGGNRTQSTLLPSLSPACSQAQWEEASICERPSHTLAACKHARTPPHLCYLKLRTETPSS